MVRCFAIALTNLQAISTKLLVPLFYQQNINETTRLAIWKIEESEGFFSLNIPLKKEITHPHKRLQHLAGRYLLPMLFHDFPNKEIEIADTRKPYLPGEQYHFSLSHCADYAAAIVSRNHRVGIDVETMTPKVLLIKTKFLHPDELDFVHTHNESEQLKLLSVAWNAKEAIYKWYGLGKVDFSEMMRLKTFELANEGVIYSRFQKPDLKADLQVQYRFFETLVLAWVVS